MATKVKAHKKISVCPHCGKKHSKSQHLSHGKDSFVKIHVKQLKKKSTQKKASKKRGLTKAEFLKRINKGRKAKGLSIIKAKK